MNEGEVLCGFVLREPTSPYDFEILAAYYVTLTDAKPGFFIDILRRMIAVSLETEEEHTETRTLRALEICPYPHVCRFFERWVEMSLSERKAMNLPIDECRFNQLLDREIDRLYKKASVLVYNTVLSFQTL